jgi:NAD-dependent protein deacetylase/lipoamidase
MPPAMTAPDETEIPALRELLQNSRRALFFTGAGISTESGIPDFRSPGGVWSRMQPIYFQDFVASEEKRREAWRRRFDNRDGWVGAQPNSGHYAVAQLIAAGKASAVITQNVDNLHQASGVPENKVIELHGNATYARCLACSIRIELADIEREFQASGTVGPCRACGGIVKSATISFGQPMPPLPMQRAHEETMACDLFVVLGSSLSVFPAADFPLRAKQKGATLVIVNRDPTEMDELADLVIHAGIGATLGAAIST